MCLFSLFCPEFVMSMYKNWYNVDRVFGLSVIAWSLTFKVKSFYLHYTVLSNCISLFQLFLFLFTISPVCEILKLGIFFHCKYLYRCLPQTNKNTLAMMTLDEPNNSFNKFASSFFSITQKNLISPRSSFGLQLLISRFVWKECLMG